MAIMIPAYKDSEIETEIHNPGEELVYNLFKNNTIPGICFHSQLLATKGDCECDFIYLTDKGILCVEVKGGNIHRENDGKIYQGKSRNKIEPFKQARKSSANLRKTLEENGLYIRYQQEYIVGYIVMFPHMQDIEDIPDIDKDLLFCGNDIQNFQSFLNNAFIATKKRLPSIEFNNIQDNLFEQIKDTLHGRFGILKYIRDKIKDTDTEIERFTKEQLLAFQVHKMNSRVVVTGDAGTGKSQIALETVRHFAKENENKKILYVCYNRFMSIYAEKWLAIDGNLPSNIEVWEYKAALKNLLLKRLKKKNPKLNDPQKYKEKDYELYTAPMDVFNGYCLDYFNDSEYLQDHPFEKFDSIVIDEAQDLLRKTTYDVFNKILKYEGEERGKKYKDPMKHGNWLLLLDENQDVFNSLDAEVYELLYNKFRPTKVKLSINCRNTRQIAEKTREISNGGCTNAPIEGHYDVKEIKYNSSETLLQKLDFELSVLKKEHVNFKDIVILSNYRQFNELGISLDKYTREGEVYELQLENATIISDPDITPFDDLDENQIRFYSYRRFKGLDAKIIIYIKNGPLESHSDGEINTDCYVAMSRAKTKLYFFHK